MNYIKRHSKQQIQAHLKAQHQSGLSVIQYCQGHHISKQSFYNWRKKYGSDLNDQELNSDFVSLTVEPPEPVQLGKPHPIIAQIKHPNGCVISFYKGCAPSFLSQTIKHL